MTVRHRIRVLHIVLNVHQGGLERVLGDLLRGMDASRFESHVLALDFLGQLARGLDEHASLRIASPLPPWSLIWPRGLAHDIRDIRPDIVHTHSGVWYKASLAARIARVPYVVHSDHGRDVPDPWVSRFLDGLASRRTDIIVGVSDALGQQLADSVVRDPGRIRVIHNGIDTQRFQPYGKRSPLRAELGLPQSTPMIGSVGRLYRIKAFDLMIEAFSLLLSKWTGVPEPVLVIGGDGPERASLGKLIEMRALKGKVWILGWREDAESLYSAFDLFTLSSHSEGTSMSLLEAMSSGVCPVVTDVGGNAAVLGRALRHRLCRPGDPVALAGAWLAALKEPLRRFSDGVAAREQVLSKFTVRSMIEQYQKLYSSFFVSGSRDL